MLALFFRLIFRLGEIYRPACKKLVGDCSASAERFLVEALMKLN